MAQTEHRGSQSPSVAVIVLNYNGVRHLRDCFDSLRRLEYPTDRHELVMVDNASTDGSVDFVRTNYAKVRIIRSPTNVGFASGNNLGARATSAEYLVFLNNDMSVDPGFLRGLVEAVCQKREIASAGAKILNWDGSRFDFAGPVCNFAGEAYQVGLGEPYDPAAYNESVPILSPCGGAMIVDRKVFLETGGFDDDYFIFYEDVDLGWRLWVLGYEVVFAPNAVTYHRHHGTMDAFANYRKLVLCRRNALFSVLKNYSDENLGRVLPAALLTAAAGAVDMAVSSGAFKLEDFSISSRVPLEEDPLPLPRMAVSSLVALHAVVQHLPTMLEKRKSIQRARKRSDEEIVRLFRPYFPPAPWARNETAYATTRALGVQGLFAPAPRRILVVTSELVPPDEAAGTEVGGRAAELAAKLASRGHDVVVSMPRDSLRAHASAHALHYAWESGRLAELVSLASPDVVLVVGSETLRRASGGSPVTEVPLILDVEFLRETPLGPAGSWDDEDVLAVGLADLMTSSGEGELLDLDGWLGSAGWPESDRRARAVVALEDAVVEAIDDFARKPSFRFDRARISVQPRPLRVRLREAYAAGGVTGVARKSGRFAVRRLATRVKGA